jgi:hypothetical protein
VTARPAGNGAGFLYARAVVSRGDASQMALRTALRVAADDNQPAPGSRTLSGTTGTPVRPDRLHGGIEVPAAPDDHPHVSQTAPPQVTPPICEFMTVT